MDIRYENARVSNEDISEKDSELGFLSAQRKKSSGSVRSWGQILRTIFPWAIAALSWILLASRWYAERQDSPRSPDLLYSPAENAVQYEVRNFHSSLTGDTTVYESAPSPEVDAAWEDLYQYGASRIPHSQAVLLPNKTAPIPADPSYYMVQLDVFHQLHCLNLIRKQLHPEYYNSTLHDHTTEKRRPPVHEDAEHFALHIDHCVDSIRQSLMCSADISTITWHWNEEKQMVRGYPGTIHTCRNWEKIKTWALEHQMQVDFDYFVKPSEM